MAPVPMPSTRSRARERARTPARACGRARALPCIAEILTELREESLCFFLRASLASARTWVTRMKQASGRQIIAKPVEARAEMFAVMNAGSGARTASVCTRGHGKSVVP